MPLGLHSQQLSAFFEPETDAPPAGQLLVESHRHLFIAVFVLPLLLAVLVHWVPALFARLHRHRRPTRKASSRRQQQQPSCHLSPDSDSHRHRHSRTRPAPQQEQEQWPQQPPQHASPPPLQTYHQLQQQHWDHFDSMSDPPQQQRQFSTPQTDRPFRRTQAQTPQARPASQQSERPFRVTQSQRVYSTPDSDGGPPSRPVPASAGRPQSQSQTPLSQTAGSRPFRASKSAAAAAATTTPRSSSQAAAGRASPRVPTTDAPFRFRDSTELERQQQHLQADGTPGYGGVPAANGGGGPMLFTSPSQQQQQPSPRWQQQRVQMQQQRQSPVWGLPQRSPAAAAAAALGSDADDYEVSSSDEEGDDVHTPAQKRSKAAGWDPSLLRRCEQQEAFISSVEGLQQSREYRKHIKQARQRHMTLELKERHKLNVYKALRNVDPESFRQLFSRKDVLEYDELPLTRTLAVCECLLSACLTFALLGAPIWLRAWQTYQTPFALLWLLQQLWVVVVCGCTSLAARVLSVYSTQGMYGMRPSCWRLLLAVAVDSLLVVGLPVLGWLALLACRLLMEQRQSCGERLLRLQPMREVVRPVHFSPYSPAGYKTVGGIETDDGEDD